MERVKPIEIEGFDLSEEDLVAIDVVGVDLARYDDSEANANAKPEDENAEDSTDETQEETREQEEEEPKGKQIVFNSEKDLQAEIDRRLKSRLERETRKREQAEAKARREAEEAAAEKNQEYEALATTRAQRIAELEAEVERLGSIEETHKEYADTLSSFADSRIESLHLPKGVKTLVERMEPKERLEWVQENEEDFTTSRETIPPDPNADDSRATPEADEAARADYQQYSMRNF